MFILQFVKHLRRKYSFFSPQLSHEAYDLVVIGSGIIGMAISRQILNENPNIKIVVVEKESEPGLHQSSHNSGVIHSGIYYKPDSLKAKLCVKGSNMILNYCQEKNIPYLPCGKLLPANSRCEIKELEALYQRGQENCVPGLEMIKSKSRIEQIQPDCQGVQALWSPNTANVDWSIITKHFLNDYLSCGGNIKYNFEVLDIKGSPSTEFPIEVGSKNQSIFTKYLVCCSGVQSENLSSFFSPLHKGKNVSFRVQYLLMNDNNNCQVRTNIYEVPDPKAPFLGIHLSPTTDGKTLLGPSALPAFGREGYSSVDLNLTYIKDMLLYSGFQKMIVKNIPKCAVQLAKSFCVEVQHMQLKKLVGTLRLEDIKPGPVAVQSQLIDEDGHFVDDFVFEFFEGEGLSSRIINCRFLPSPAATSSMAIAKLVSAVFSNQFERNARQYN